MKEERKERVRSLFQMNFEGDFEIKGRKWELSGP